jgi:N-methylhydantoinase A/oxoprolinase/acetone carboxylase beta subunit
VRAAPPASGAAEVSRRAVKGTRPAYSPEARGFLVTPVYDRYALLPGAAFAGPAIIEERESTLLVGRSGRCEVLAGGSIIVAIDAA